MYELSRVKLVSVGPPGARYQDVTLDLSGVGQPVENQQPTLLGPDEPVRRPSPASVLFLENGGGKSVLIKLIFSVMLPGRRQVVGTTNTRVLEKFVQAVDVSHVALEWMHSGTGRRLVTGKVSEWRGRVVSADPDNLIDYWYAFRPGEVMDFDRLPFIADNRYLSMSAFRDLLHEAEDADPGMELKWTKVHGDWTERLDMLGLDTELFRYQRAMNAGEAEAAEVFKFNTDEAFVEFLLRAVFPEDGPRDVAEVLATYSATIARRADLTVEKEFVDGALQRLTPLAHEESLAAVARGREAQALRNLQVFAAGVRARNAGEVKLAAARQVHVDELIEAEKVADGEHRGKAAIVDALKRCVAELRLANAEEDKARVEKELEAAMLTAEAWRAAPTVLARRITQEQVRRLRDVVTTTEDGLRPALEARNAAAVALVRGLLSTAGESIRQAEREESLAKACEQRLVEAHAEQVEALTNAAISEAQAQQLRLRIDEVRTETADAVREGLLDEDVPVSQAAAVAGEAAQTAELRLAEATTESDRLSDLHTQALEDLHEAQLQAAAARGRHRAAAAALSEAAAQTDGLAAVPRLGELLDVDEVNLESDVDALLDLLAEVTADAELERIGLNVAESSEERIRIALDNGDLLPPPDETATVCAVLNDEENIVAWTGWDYLAGIPDVAERQSIARRVPQLAAGVVVNDPLQVDRAKEVLSERGVLTNVFVAMGTTRALRDMDACVPDGADFVVSLNPALYDPDAAAAEHASIQERHDERRQRLAELTDALNADLDIARRLAGWRQEYPPGKIAALVEAEGTAAEELTRAEAAVAEAQTALDRVVASRSTLRDQLPIIAADARRLEREARRLSELASLDRRLAGWGDEANALDQVVEFERLRAEETGATVARLRSKAAEHYRAADACRGIADRVTTEVADVPGGDATHDDETVPDEPLEVLRRDFRTAMDAYARIEAGGSVRVDLDLAEREAAEALAAEELLPDNVRERAVQLLTTPDAADVSTRAAALETTTRLSASLDQRRTEAISMVATRKADLTQIPASPAALGHFERPRDVAHGQTLIQQAMAEQSVAARGLADLQQRRQEAERLVAGANRSADAFDVLVKSMTVPAPDEEVDVVYDGDASSARQRYAALVDAWGGAQRLAGQANDRVNGAADELAEFSTQFEKLNAPVRRQIAAARRAELPRYAHEWEQALRPRLRTLTDDLANIDRHRRVIVARLQGMVNTALQTLRMAQRVSRMPEGLGDWYREEFLQFTFTPLQDNLLAERLADVVDETAAGRTSDGRELKKDGLSLLIRGVLASCPKGFRVDLLKPDSVLRTERERVSDMKDAFSEGQQLTAAIILYCTMAALRANNRGRIRQRHSGVLFLDNPIGRASAGFLLDLQLGMAKALGVQLIYTTGLFDAGALSEFPLLIRLRNDADLRAGKKYLTVERTIQQQLDTLPDPDDEGHLTATRIFVRDETEDDATNSAGDGSHRESPTVGDQQRMERQHTQEDSPPRRVDHVSPRQGPES
jgi:hypothetical protein